MVGMLRYGTGLESHLLLTVVLAGDQRLLERFRSDELLPLNSRMRVRLALDRATPEELRECPPGDIHSSTPRNSIAAVRFGVEGHDPIACAARNLPGEATITPGNSCFLMRQCVQPARVREPESRHRAGAPS
jgi:hypothetical protein